MHTSGTILVIEDDEAIRETLAELLRDEGYEVCTAANGREALMRLRGSDKPCVILLDMMMPVMNGWEFRTEQLADPGLAGIPVVILSGAANVPHEIAALGAVTYLRKPFRIDQVVAAVRAAC